LRVERADFALLFAVRGSTRAHQRLRERAELTGVCGRFGFLDACRHLDLARGDERRIVCERGGDEALHARAIARARSESCACESVLQRIADCGGHPRRAIPNPERHQALDHVAGVEVWRHRDERVVVCEERRRTGCAERRSQHLRRTGRQHVRVVGGEHRALGERARAGFVACERRSQILRAHDAHRSEVVTRRGDRLVRDGFDVERRGRGEEEHAAETGPVDAQVREHALQCREQAAQQVFVDETQPDPLHEDAVRLEAIANQREELACVQVRGAGAPRM
jgi:hypothetical protein